MQILWDLGLTKLVDPISSSSRRLYFIALGLSRYVEYNSVRLVIFDRAPRFLVTFLVMSVGNVFLLVSVVAVWFGGDFGVCCGESEEKVCSW